MLTNEVIDGKISEFVKNAGAACYNRQAFYYIIMKNGVALKDLREKIKQRAKIEGAQINTGVLCHELKAADACLRNIDCNNEFAKITTLDFDTQVTQIAGIMQDKKLHYNFLFSSNKKQGNKKTIYDFIHNLSLSELRKARNELNAQICKLQDAARDAEARRKLDAQKQKAHDAAQKAQKQKQRATEFLQKQRVKKLKSGFAKYEKLINESYKMTQKAQDASATAKTEKQKARAESLLQKAIYASHAAQNCKIQLQKLQIAA